MYSTLTYDNGTPGTTASVVEEITVGNTTLVIIEASAQLLNYAFTKEIVTNSAPPVIIINLETPSTTASTW